MAENDDNSVKLEGVDISELMKAQKEMSSAAIKLGKSLYLDSHAMADFVTNSVKIADGLKGITLPSEVLSLKIPNLDLLPHGFEFPKIELPKWPDPSTFLDLGAIADLVQGSWEGIMEEFKINKKTGWWSVVHILDELPASEVNRALRSEATDGAYTELLIRELRSNDFKKLKETWERWGKYDFISTKRREILKDIIDAHIQEKYTLTIPAILPQIDFFFREELAVKHKEIEDKNPPELPEGEIRYRYLVDAYPVQFFFREILFAHRDYRKKQEEERKKLSEASNRNRILHGEDEDYATEKLSAKAILFLDKIFDLLAESEADEAK